MPFCIAKHALLHVKRCPFTLQKGMFYNAKGRRLKSKEERNWQKGAELRNEKRPLSYGLPKPLQRRGCAWRDTECWVLGRWKEEEIGLKGCLFILNGQMFRGQKYGFITHRPSISQFENSWFLAFNSLSLNSKIRSFYPAIPLSVIRKFVVFSIQLTICNSCNSWFLAFN